jgi:glycosyltransferase involved in cell wall biosynthesis
VQTQVLPYLRQLALAGIKINLLTFEPKLQDKWSKDELADQRTQLMNEGINWFSLPYHKSPSLPATIYDIFNGARFARHLMRDVGLDIIHARSHVAATMGALATRSTQVRLLFDIRGFLPEEYTDSGVWPPDGYLYRLTKAVEGRLLTATDGFVVLTEKARQILFPESTPQARARPVEVIPCCVDLNHFRGRDAVIREEMRHKLGVADRRVVVYVGSLKGWYLTDEMADLLGVMHQQDRQVFSLILTQSPSMMITSRLQQRGIGEKDYKICKVSPAEVPSYLNAADVAVSFIKPCFSKLSSSPTKMAEYLASGLPVICNAGIGDLDELIKHDRVGVLLRDFNEASYLQALDELKELERDVALPTRCRSSAIARFDLVGIGGARYRRLYERILVALRTLYICYFGIRQPLVQTQVLPYLRQLSNAGIEVNLLTFEPNLAEEWGTSQLEAQREQLANEGIRWFYLPYHKSPSLPATLFDIFAGTRLIVKLVRQLNINVLHARAHVPMAMALMAQHFARVKLIFDIRGLMAEEYADAGIWKEQSLPFRLVKRLERAGIDRANQIVVLTERLRKWMTANKLKSPEQINVIPCCVDFDRFAGVRHAQSRTDRFEVVYAGSLLGLYLVEEMGRFFNAVKSERPDAFLRILSASPPGPGIAALKLAGLSDDDFEIINVPPEEVPKYLSGARLGVSFRKSSFAQIAASPTKVPEYLAVGIPSVCNSGIGDMDDLLERERVGVVLQGFDDSSYRAAAVEAIKLAENIGIRQKARNVAHQHFDLETVGGQRYFDVYRKLEVNRFG